MNRENGTVVQNTRKPTEPVAASAQTRRHKQTSDRFLRVMRIAIVTLCTLAIVMGSILIVLPTFSIEEIVVVGSKHYSAEQIIAASGIRIGDEIYAVEFGKQEIRERIWAWDDGQTPIINKIGIECSSGRVTISIEEYPNITYASINGFFYLLDRDFHILHVTANEEELAAFPEIKLPTVVDVSEDSQLIFAVDTAYIREMFDFLEEEALFSDVTELDVAKKYNISYVVNDRCRITLGKPTDLFVKHGVAAKILSEKGTSADRWAVVDVSDLQKPTYRALASAELLQN